MPITRRRHGRRRAHLVFAAHLWCSTEDKGQRVPFPCVVGGSRNFFGLCKCRSCPSHQLADQIRREVCRGHQGQQVAHVPMQFLDRIRPLCNSPSLLFPPSLWPFFPRVRLGAGWAIGKFRSQTRLLREWKALCSRDCNAPRPLAPDPNCGSPHHGSLPLIGNKDMVALILAAHASIATTEKMGGGGGGEFRSAKPRNPARTCGSQSQEALQELEMWWYSGRPLSFISAFAARRSSVRHVGRSLLSEKCAGFLFIATPH